jgi:CBS domain-containing protein
MTTMRAAQIMRQPVLAATRKATVRDLITHLVVNQISGMPVVEPDGSVVGVVSEGDVLRVLVEGDPLNELLVQDIMTNEPITVDCETPVSEVLYTVHTEGILRVPVTKAGTLVGIISRSDLIRTVAELEPVDEPDFLTF